MEYRLLVTYRESPDTYGDSGAYLTITARIMEWADDDTPRNIRADRYSRDPYAYIGATAQSDRRPDRLTDGTASYAWHFGMAADDLETVDSEQVALTLATLRKVERKLDATAERFGAPGTFGAYVARIADALGIKVATQVGDTPPRWYTDGRYVTWNTGEAASIIDDRIARFQRA